MNARPQHGRNAAVAMLLAELRAEILVAPHESLADEHVNLMRFEAQIVGSARRAPANTPANRGASRPVRTRVRSAVAARPRRAAALIAAVSVLVGSVGLNAAGALPDAISHLTDHITDTIVHTFGVPQASQPHAASASRIDTAPGRAAAPIDGAPRTSQATVGASGASAAVVSSAAPAGPVATDPGPHAGTGTGTGAGTPPQSQPGSGGSTGPVSQPPDRKPPHKDQNKDPSVPAGFPSDWQQQAIAAGRAQLGVCAQAVTLAPVDCPQSAGTTGVTAIPDSVRWTVLNQPLAGAVAVVEPGATTAVGARVSVYGLFQMTVAYTVGGDATHPLLAYSGGAAQATMTWDGTGFQPVTFTTGTITQLPSGVFLPPFTRPASVTDAGVLAAVGAGFAADTSWANLAGDPLQGATVAFDTQHGDFTVTGSYATTAGPDATNPVSTSGHYTATLAFDGSALQLIAITGSP